MNNRIVVILFTALLSGCDVQPQDDKPNSRPDSISPHAQWIGGADGGVFINITPTETPRIYTGTIYSASGVILYRGRLRHTGNTAFDVNNADSYQGWDGDFLFLRHQEKLVAIDQDGS